MTTDNGSDVLRALWQRQSGSSFSMEPDEMQKRLSRAQANSRDVKMMVYIVCPGIAIWCAYCLIFTTQAIITRVGLLLSVLGMSFWVGQVWLYNRDLQKTLANSDAAGQTNCIEFYRAELVRQRDFHRAGWLWSRLLALYVGLFFGMWEPLRGSNTAPRIINLLTVSILAMLSVWLSYRKSRKLQQQIDAMDAMQQANGAGGAP
jgi:hypothetical protein